MLRGARDRSEVELVESILDVLCIDEPAIRVDLVEAARARLASGMAPSAWDVAETVVAEFA